MGTARVLCSTGAFSRESDARSADHVVAGMRRLEGTPFEVIFYAPWYEQVDGVARRIAEVGAQVPVLHAEKGIGPLLASESDDDVQRAVAALRTNCSFAREIGAGRIILHLWGLPLADENFAAALAGLPLLADVADEFAMELTVETIPCAVLTPLERVRQAVAAEPRVFVTLDTEFLAFHDEFDTARYDDDLWRHDLVRHVHIKDFDGSPTEPDGSRRYLQPGEGCLDLNGFVRDAHARGFHGTISLEASALDPEGHADMGRIAASLRLLSTWAEDTESLG